MVLQNQLGSVSLSTNATIPELQQSKTAVLMHSLLGTHGGAMNTPLTSSSPGTAANPDWSSTVPSW